jgi:hypothetical protein
VHFSGVTWDHRLWTFLVCVNFSWPYVVTFSNFNLDSIYVFKPDGYLNYYLCIPGVTNIGTRRCAILRFFELLVDFFCRKLPVGQIVGFYLTFSPDLVKYTHKKSSLHPSIYAVVSSIRLPGQLVIGQHAGSGGL